MYMGFCTSFAIPSECLICKVNVNIKTFKKRFPYTCNLFALSYRIGRDKSSVYSSTMHKLCGFKVLPCHIVDFARSFI